MSNETKASGLSPPGKLREKLSEHSSESASDAKLSSGGGIKPPMLKGDGWYLHYRNVEKQFEVCYRVAANKWKKHRVDRSIQDDGNAVKYAKHYVAEKKKIGFAPAHSPSDAADGPTFGEFAQEWTSGKLHKKFPDHVRIKSTSEDDATRAAILEPAIGHVPIKRFTLDHAEEAMRRLDELRIVRDVIVAEKRGRRAKKKMKALSSSSRRQYAQLIHKVLAMAVYPARLLAANPLPKGFLPRPGGKKALAYLYPDEDRQLLACDAVPLAHRVLYGFMAREGMREGEALSMTWGDLDLKRGAITLDENKTDDPRSWALSPGVAAALAAWRERSSKSKDKDLVFVDCDGHEHEATNMAPDFRSHLRLAKVTRPELFEKSQARVEIRFHDLRATFVTTSLANGKTETWVIDRTGHGSSTMVNRYRRAARKWSELGLGSLVPLDVAVTGLVEHSTALVVVPPVNPSTEVREQLVRLVAELVAAGLSRGKSRKANQGKTRVGHDRLELSANGLRVRCSTN